MNYDGSMENAYVWKAPTDPPYTIACGGPFSQCGAFAECYTSPAGGCHVCGIQLFLTRVSPPVGSETANLYIWTDNGGQPGLILTVVPQATLPSPISYWPTVVSEDMGIPSTFIPAGKFWVGYKTYPGDYCVCADLDGFGGCPYTYVPVGAPSGGPPGWHNTGTVPYLTPTPYLKATALGIGVYVQ